MISNVAWVARPVCIIQWQIFAADGGRGAGTHLHRGLRWFYRLQFGAVAYDSRVNTCEIMQGLPLQLFTDTGLRRTSGRVVAVRFAKIFRRLYESEGL